MLLFVNLQVAIKEHGIMLIPNSHVMAQNMSKDPDPGAYKCWEIVTLTKEVWGFMLITSPLPCNSVVVDGKYPREPAPEYPEDPGIPYGPIGGGGRTPNAESTTHTPSGAGNGHGSTPSQTSTSSRKHNDDRHQMDEMMDEDEIINTPYSDEPRMDLDFDDLHIPDIDWITGGSVGEQGKAKAPCPDDPKGFDPETQPGAFEGAVMSELSYGNKETRGDCKDKLKDDYGWEVADEEAKKMGIKLHDEISGLDCTLLKKRDGSGYVLAFAGTDPKKNVSWDNIKQIINPFSELKLAERVYELLAIAPDVRTDIYQFLFGMDVQYLQAMTNAITLKEKLGDNADITFVGHSLGGGLASLASLVTDCPALTYNPAALCPMSKLELMLQGYNIDSSKINRYTMEKDPVSGFQGFVNTCLNNVNELFDFPFFNYCIAQGHNIDVDYDEKISLWYKYNPNNILKHHECVTIIDNLDCDEIKWSNK